MKSFHKNALAVAIGVALSGLPALSSAVTDPDLKALREEIAQMKQAYQQRIDTLEKRLTQAEIATNEKTARIEAKADQVQAAVQQAAAQQPAPPPIQSNAFNPEISMILQGSYNNLKQDPKGFQIYGFIPTLGAVGPGTRGFSLGESELTISANVDPDWRATAIASLAPEGGVEMENAYFESLGLGNGFSFKAGRFFSAIGYQNEQHTHAWDFVDAPLAYKVFLGNQLADDGVQLRWLAPTDLFLEVGAEAGRGRSFPGADNNKNGVSSGSVFAHLGGDVGLSNAWRIGLSTLASSPRDRSYKDVDSTGAAVTNNFTGKSRLWIADGIWKWAPNGNANSTNFKLQGEYFQRRENGTLASNSLTANCGGACAAGYDSRQSGGYVQGVYQFMPRWRAGLRYDELNFGSANIGLVESNTLTPGDFPLLAGHDPRRSSLMFDYSPSEFTRFRLQFARDDSGLGRTDNQMFLQYILSLGTHGAHSF